MPATPIAPDSAGDLTRAHALIDSVRPGEMLVVATLGTGGGAAILTFCPTATALVNLASSLLDSALDALRDAGQHDSDLAEQIEDALGLLPDRFADLLAEEG